jgi:hypothetical protein
VEHPPQLQEGFSGFTVGFAWLLAATRSPVGTTESDFSIQRGSVARSRLRHTGRSGATTEGRDELRTLPELRVQKKLAAL